MESQPQPNQGERRRRKAKGRRHVVNGASSSAPISIYNNTNNEYRYASPSSTNSSTLSSITETLHGISSATAHLILNPANIRNLMLDAIKRSIGLQRQTITSSGHASPVSNDLENEINDYDQVDSSRTSLYVGFLNRDKNLDQGEHVSSPTLSTSANTEIEDSKFELNLEDLNAEESKAKIIQKLEAIQNEKKNVLEMKENLEFKMNRLKEKLERLNDKDESLERESEELKMKLKELDQPDTLLTSNIDDIMDIDSKKDVNDVNTEKHTDKNETVELSLDIPDLDLEKIDAIKINIEENEVVSEGAPEIKHLDTQSVVSFAQSSVSNINFPQTIKAHENPITGISLDVNNNLLITSDDEGWIKLWEPESMDETYMLQLEIPRSQGPIFSIKVVDGILASSHLDHNVRIWNTRSLLSNKEDMSSPNSEIDQLCEQNSLTPNVILSDSPTSRPRSEASIYSAPPSLTLPSSNYLPAFNLKGHKSYVSCLDMDPNTLISGSNDGTMKQWDVESGKLISTFDITWHMNMNAVSKLKKQYSEPILNDIQYQKQHSLISSLQFYKIALASGTYDGVIRMWDLRTGQSHRSLLGHKAPITCLAFDPIHLISGALDNTVKIWDLRTGKELEQIKFESKVNCLQFDEKRLFSGYDSNNIQVYERLLFQQKQLKGHKSFITQLHLVEDGPLISGDQNGIVHFWNL